MSDNIETSKRRSGHQECTRVSKCVRQQSTGFYYEQLNTVKIIITCKGNRCTPLRGSNDTDTRCHAILHMNGTKQSHTTLKYTFNIFYFVYTHRVHHRNTNRRKTWLARAVRHQRTLLSNVMPIKARARACVCACIVVASGHQTRFRVHVSVRASVCV